MLLVGPEDDFNIRIARGLGLKLVPLERRIFPDGEICPRVQKEVRGSDVVLSLRMKSGVGKPNDYLLEVLFTLRNLRRHMGAGDITLIMPYFPYARQDAIFRTGEPLSPSYLAEMLEEAGANSIVSVTVHLHRLGSFSEIFKKIKATNLSGFKALSESVKRLPLKDPFIIGPDTESIHWARELAQFCGIEEYDAFRKERDLETGDIRTYIKEIDLKDRDVIVVDDMVSTGGTMANAVAAAREMGARLVVSAFVHPILVPGSIDKILGAGADIIIATDTIEWRGSKASVTRDIIDTLGGG